MADSLRPTAPAWWPPAHVVRSPPARAPTHGAARAAWSRPCPPACPPRRPRRAWAQPGGRCVCGRGGRPPPPSRRRPPGRPASRASRRPHLRSRRTAPSRDASAPAPRGTRNTGSCAMGYPSRGSRPSRTAQPPLRAPVVGRELPSRKDDRGGTTAGTTGIASGFLTRVKHDPQACNFDNFRQQTPAKARTHQSRLFGLSRKSNSPIVRMPSSSM